MLKSNPAQSHCVTTGAGERVQLSLRTASDYKTFTFRMAVSFRVSGK